MKERAGLVAAVLVVVWPSVRFKLLPPLLASRSSSCASPLLLAIVSIEQLLPSAQVIKDMNV